MKAVIEYSDFMGDEKEVSTVLSQRKAKVVKTSHSCLSSRAFVTVEFETNEELNELVYAMNKATIYGGTIKKIKKK